MEPLAYRKMNGNVLIMLGRRGRVGVVQLPTEEAVRSHLGVILAWPGFANSERLCRFLRYTVEKKLRGEEGQIKEFVLGQEVFDRGPDYDPRLDPIVRVEARRLRQRLAEYYDGPGREEAVRIAFPKGGYAPVFEGVQAAKRGRFRWEFLVAAAGACGGAYWVARPRGVEMAVVPARWVWENRVELEEADEALAEAITAGLVRKGVSVAGWPVVARQRGGGVRDVRVLGKELGVREVAVVSVRRAAGGMRVTVFRLDAVSGEKRFVQDFFGGDVVEVAGWVAGAIAGR